MVCRLGIVLSIVAGVAYDIFGSDSTIIDLMYRNLLMHNNYLCEIWKVLRYFNL